MESLLHGLLERLWNPLADLDLDLGEHDEMA